GNLVFSGASDKVGWDGFYKGILQPSDTYTWVAEGIDHSGKIIRSGGNTILIR
ncbi:MAG: internalin, partial [Chitinophagaceae bacterium]|nr:internalin [Chitinophagaceae bacterium]